MGPREMNLREMAFSGEICSPGVPGRGRCEEVPCRFPSYLNLIWWGGLDGRRERIEKAKVLFGCGRSFR